MARRERLIDVRAYPGMAGEFERRTGVGHESPQAILLLGGRAAWSASHSEVTAAAITAAKEARSRDHAGPAGSPA